MSLWLPVVAYAAAIFALSATSNPSSPPGGLSDKHGHLILYAGLGALLVRALSGGRWRGVTLTTAIAAVVLATLYGASDEWHQTFVAGRSASGIDLAADALGALMAAGVLYAWAIIRRS